MECFIQHLAWIEDQFLRGIRDSGSLWGRMRGVAGVRKSIHQSWLANGLGLGLRCWGFKGVQEEIPSEEARIFKSGQWHFHQDNTPVHSSILVTDYLTKMGIKTVSYTPYSLDLAPFDFCLFPSSVAVVMRQLRRWMTLCRRSLTRSYKTTCMGLPEVAGTVQQVYCRWRRLLQRILEFHVCTVYKSSHTKKVWKLI